MAKDVENVTFVDVLANTIQADAKNSVRENSIRKEVKDLTVADIQSICQWQRQQWDCANCKLSGWLCGEAVKYWPVGAGITVNVPN